MVKWHSSLLFLVEGQAERAEISPSSSINQTRTRPDLESRDQSIKQYKPDSDQTRSREQRSVHQAI